MPNLSKWLEESVKESKRGRWLKFGNDPYQCSECKSTSKRATAYCYACGAKMDDYEETQRIKDERKDNE